MGTAKKQVMDVNKPGKAAAPATARPVIVGHGAMVQDPMVRRAQTGDDAAAADPLLESRPKRDHMVVKPLSGTDSERDADIKSRLSGAGPAAPADAKAADDAADADAADDATSTDVLAGESDVFATTGEDVTAGADPDAVANDAAASQESDDAPSQGESAASPSSSRSDKSSSDKKASDKPKGDTKNDKPKNAAGDDTGDDDEVPETSEAASIDAVVSQASSKKVAQDQEAKRREQDAAIQKLVDDKTYFVHVGQPKSHGAVKYVLLTIVMLVLAAVLYVGVDAGVFGNGIKVPFHVLPQTEESTAKDAPATTATQQPSAVAQAQPPTSEPTEQSSSSNSEQAASSEVLKNVQWATFSDAGLGLAFTYPKDLGSTDVAKQFVQNTAIYQISFARTPGVFLYATPSNLPENTSSYAKGLSAVQFKQYTSAKVPEPYVPLIARSDTFLAASHEAGSPLLTLWGTKDASLKASGMKYVQLFGLFVLDSGACDISKQKVNSVQPSGVCISQEEVEVFDAMLKSIKPL